MTAVLLSAVLAATAVAQGGEGVEGPKVPVLTPRLIEEANESPTVNMEVPAPDLAAARKLPHAELGRSEALELLESVFAPAVERPAGIYDEMPTAKFVSDNAAVMRLSPEEAGGEQTDEGGQEAARPVLVESTVPLRTEDESGQDAPVDLTLEKADGEVRPSNPLVATSLPTELHEGIEIGEGKVTISFPEAAPERTPSIVDEDSAFYPSVQKDTDLLVTPNPTGVEILTELRTAQAPRTETQTLSLEEGASLKSTDEGGAEAEVNGRTVLKVEPPTAIDAAGNDVPVTLSVSGDAIELTVSPSVDAAYPILVDPIYQNYNWAWEHNSFAGWFPYDSAPGYLALERAGQEWALDLTSGYPGGASPNTGAQWIYEVPRYNTEGEHAESYIEGVTLSSAMFITAGNNSSFPEEVNGIQDPIHGGWVSVGSYYGYQGEFVGWSGSFSYPNPTANVDGKVFSYGLITLESEGQAKYRTAITGTATVTLGDQTTPQLSSFSGPTGWWNTGEPTVAFDAVDGGLGIYAAQLIPAQNSSGATANCTSPWESCPGKGSALVPCNGTSASPCPRDFRSGEYGATLPLKASSLAEGVDHFRVIADSPLHQSELGAATVPMRVDHSPPTIALSGTATEQTILGTSKPQYTLKYSAADGTREAPNESLLRGEATPAGGKYKEPSDVTVAPDETLWVADTGNNQIDHLTRRGVPIANYAAVGSESLTAPKGIASDSSGNIWVADTGHNRLVEFNPKGEVMWKIGGTSTSEFSAPQGVAVAPNGNIWVADTGNNRVLEFTGARAFVGSFDAAASPGGPLHVPQGIAVGPNGNVWVADTGDNRIVELSSTGKYLAAFGSLGSGQGQFNKPIGIDVDNKGNVTVIDKGNSRVEQLSERGDYLDSFSSGVTTFAASAGIATMPTGEIWVTSSGYNPLALQEWTPPVGTRSGVRSVTVKMDGKVLEKPEESCPQGGCPLSGEVTIHSGEYTAATHTLEIIATDGVNLSTTKTINLTLKPPAPSMTLSGTATEQATLGYTRPRYTLKVAAGAEEGTGVSASTPSYVSSFGTEGTGPGQFGHPAGIAIDSEENLWVADSVDNRIDEFNRSGQFVKAVGSTGSGGGHFSTPKAIAIAPSGHFWVADAGNNRLDEFSPTWEFIRSVGSQGSGNGQFSGPEGIAIGPEGTMWVSDTYNHRVQEFNAKGEFVKIVTGLGSIEPTGITVTPTGLVWITDWAGNRVVELSSAGSLLKSVGSAGSGPGQFSHPDAVAVDAGGDVWVGDQSDGRVEEFSKEGSYLGEFGAAGTGPGQFRFSYPMDIAADTHGNLWVSDPENHRVQRWFEGRRSSVKTEITIDGTPIDTAEAVCSTETCPTTRETVISLPPSNTIHALVVKATDGYGKSTSTAQLFRMQADTTKPTLQIGGELSEAPEGWVQQESYGFNATASDAKGYGVTSLALKIDGSTVASSPQACPEGACTDLLHAMVDMGPYAGGEHKAEVVAVDGAGNSVSKSWTINVDPEGHVTSAEATATLEAAENTGLPPAIGEYNEEEPIDGAVEGLGLEETASGYEAVGSKAPTSFTDEPEGTMTILVPTESEIYPCESAVEEEEGCVHQVGDVSGAGQPVKITPIDTEGQGSAPYSLVEGNAAVAPNSQDGVDQIVRPLDDGGMIFDAIREESAPHEFSYEVHLGEEQFLESVDPQHAEVYYGGHSPAFGITAEPAHDAVGTAVPTTLSVTGRDVVTLTVHLNEGPGGQPFVYPVVTGTGWEGGFTTIVVEMNNPTPPSEPGEPACEEGCLAEGVEGGISIMTAGPPVGDPERKFKFTFCKPHHIPGSAGLEEVPQFNLPIPEDDEYQGLPKTVSECSNPEFKGIFWAVSIHGHFHYEPHHWIWLTNFSEAWCSDWGEEAHFFVQVHCKEKLEEPGQGPDNKVHGPITTLGEWRIPPGAGQNGVAFRVECLTIEGFLFPRSGNPKETFERPMIPNPEYVIPQAQQCNWQ
jgi:sugar lactone lactonase YvrE